MNTLYKIKNKNWRNTYFLICLFLSIVAKTFAVPPPSNDNPCNAIVITPSATPCPTPIPVSYTNQSATNTSGIPNPGCGNYSGGDVWFQVTVPAGGALNFATQSGGMFDGAMAIYNATSCAGPFTLISCSDDVGASLMPSINATGLTAGATVWVRMFSNSNSSNGTFGLCVYAPPPPPPPPPPGSGTTCALSVCVPQGGFPTQSNVPSMGSNGIYGCLGSTPNPTWNLIQANSFSPITINISQASGGTGPPYNDIDFVCWGPFVNPVTACANISAGNIVSCSYSASGTETCTIASPVPGDYYILLTTNFNNCTTCNVFYNISPSTSVINCPSICSISNLTSVTTSCTPATNTYSVNGVVTFTNSPSTGTLNIGSSCGGSISINPPFVSPLAYSIPNITSNGSPCTVTASFSASACSRTSNYTAPVACNACSVSASGGGIFCEGTTINLTGTPVIPASGTGLTYAWTGPNGFNSALQNPTIVSATTSASGTYTLTATFTASGTTCTSTTSVTVNAIPVSSINYTASPYCQNATNPIPSFTGTSGGVYSSTAGLTIDSNTGLVDLLNSTAGNYVVTYNFSSLGCAAVTTTTITVTTLPTATINYTGSPYCQNASNPSPIFTGTTGGLYSSTAGLIIDATTGLVDLLNSSSGNYVVTYSISAFAGCSAVTATSPITITASPAATINYVASPYCKNASNPSPTFVGTTGGTYSSTVGLTIDATTGLVDLVNSAAGNYVVTYSISVSGGCADVTATSPITITILPTATINYTASPYCQNSTNPTPTFTGTTGGSYSSASGLTVDVNSGLVDLINSTVGNYMVTYSISASAGCPDVTATSPITITAMPTATINYTGSPYCQNGTNPTPTFTGTTGGNYSSTIGLSINSVSGLLDLTNSTTGNYIVTYSISASAGCPDVTATSSITITTLPTATISYASSPYCQNTSNPSPTFTGTTGGLYSSTTGLAINSTSGLVDLTNCTVGNYVVTYSISASAGCPDVTATSPITITALPTAILNYAGSPYCQNATNPTPTFTGTTGGTYSSTAGLAINSVSGLVDLLNSTTGNTYVVTYSITASGGCPAVSSTANIVINPNPTPIANNNGPICGGSALNLSSTNYTGANYSWTGPLSFSSSVQNPTVSSNATTGMAGNYSVTVSLNGCTGTANTSVVVNALPTASVTGGGSVCVGNPLPAVNIILTGTAPWNITYSDGTNNISDSPSTNPYSIANPVTGTYSLISVADANCLGIPSPNTVLVNIKPKPLAAASVNNAAGCSPWCVTFTDLSSALAPNVIASSIWDYGDGSASGASINHCYNTGNYSVRITTTSSNGCTDDSLYHSMVTAYPVPLTKFTVPQHNSILNPTVQFSNNSINDTHWLWNFGDSLSSNSNNSSNLQNPSHTYSAPGNYCVELKIDNTFCFDSTTLCFDILPEFSFYVPDAFSPNGDGVNDEFYGKGVNIAEYEMHIYDRWGNKLFSTNDTLKHWDGTVKDGSKVAQQDSYVYIIKIKDNLDEKHEYIGNVTIIR